MADSDELWDYLPGIGALSLAIIIKRLWLRYKNNEISYTKFKYLVMRSTGMKAIKLTTLTFVLMIPVVGQITGIILLANFIIQVMK